MEQSRGRRGDARQRYLSLWAHTPIAPSRLDPDTPYIRHPVVTIVGGIQPLVYASLRSKDHDGFLERFLPVFVGGRSDYWSESTVTATPPPDLDAVTDLLAKLRAIPAAGQVGDPEGLLVLRDRAARDVWATWYNDNIDRIDAVPLVVQGFYQKLPAHVARIALILHALWNPDAPDSPLGGDTMIHATRIAECFRGHIHRAILLLGDFDRVPAPRPTLAQRCLRILAETADPDGWTSRTDIYHRLGRPHPDDLTYALDSLATRGLVRSRRITPPRARKPVEQWRATTPADRYGPDNAT